MINVLRSLVREAIVVDAEHNDLGNIDRIEVTEDGVFIILEDVSGDDPNPGEEEDVPEEHSLPEETTIPDVPGTPPKNVHSIRRKVA